VPLIDVLVRPRTSSTVGRSARTARCSTERSARLMVIFASIVASSGSTAPGRGTGADDRFHVHREVFRRISARIIRVPGTQILGAGPRGVRSVAGATM
jgi:hypothetical protein